MDPHWSFQILLGGIFGVALPYIIKIIIWPSQRFRKHFLKRDWWQYHYSEKEGKFRIFESKLKIETGILNPLVFKETQIETNLSYKGKVLMEKDSSQFLLIGNSTDSEHDENFVCRFHYPIKTQSSIITGVHVSFTHSKTPYSSPLILSDKKLGLDEAKSILSRAVISTPEDVSIIMIDKYTNHLEKENLTPSDNNGADAKGNYKSFWSTIFKKSPNDK